MGLDMYLIKRNHIGATYAHNEVHGSLSINKCGRKLPIKLNRVQTIDELVGYWRKAYAVHNWFSCHVIGGIEDCKDYYFDIEIIKELYDDVCVTLESPQSGYIRFPGADQGEWFWQDMRETKRILHSVIKDYEECKELGIPTQEYVYRPSW